MPPRPPQVVFDRASYAARVGEAVIVDLRTSKPSPGATLKSGHISWGDGDGGTWTGKPARESHIYQQVGTFTITVTITDTKGQAAVGTRTASITVMPPTPLPPTPQPPPIPGSPTNVQAIPGDAQITVQWGVVSGATHYRLKQSLALAGPYVTISETVTNGGVASPRTNGTPYFFVVTALNVSGESAPSTPVTATPVATPPPDPPDPPPTGNIVYVHAGQNLQAAIDTAAVFGGETTIILDSGAEYTNGGQRFVLRGRTANAPWITIQPSNLAAIPAGTRVVPGTHAAAMARLVGNADGALAALARANHYKLLGLEFTTDGLQYAPDVVTLGSLGSGAGGYATLAETLATTDLTIDRCFIHPSEVTAANLKPASVYRHSGRGVHLAGVRLNVTNSWIGGFAGYYPLSVGLGDFYPIDSSGIYYDGILIDSLQENNYAEAAFNNIFFGGADPASANTATLTNATTTSATFSSVSNLQIGDLVSVYFSSAFTTAGGKGGCHWGTVKVTNIVGQQVSYVGFGASGNLPGPPDSPGEARWDGYYVENVIVRRNTLAKLTEWLSMGVSASRPSGIAGQHKAFIEFKSAVNCTVEDNVCISSGYHGTAFAITPRNQGGAAPWNTVSGLTIQRNRMVNAIGALLICSLEDNEATSTPGHHITFAHNLADQLTNDNYNYVFQLAGGHHVTIQHNTLINTGTSNIAASGVVMTTPSITFTDNILGGSAYGWSCFVAPGGLATCWPGFVESNNLIANNLGADTSWAPNSTVVPSFAAVQFVDLAGGNYRLQASSPGHLAASDGTDIGANIDLLP